MQHAVELSVVDFIPEDSIDFVFVTAEHNALDITDFLPLCCKHSPTVWAEQRSVKVGSTQFAI